MIKSLLNDALKIPEVFSWILIKYLISKRYFTDRGDLKLDFCSRALEGLFDEESGHATKKFKKDFKKLLKKKEINKDLLDFSAYVFLHSFVHLFYQYVLDKLKTNDDNLAYYIDGKNCKVYLLENAEKGLGLTEALVNIINQETREGFFVKFLEDSLKIISECEYNKNKLKALATKEISERINLLTEKERKQFEKINKLVRNINKTIRDEYNIDFPIEILRGILTRRFGYNPMIIEAIVSEIPYCWDGCYNCVRLERNCNYDPFRQMTRISKILFTKIIEQILTELKIPIEVRKGFKWVLGDIDKTKNILRISSPWISKPILQEHIEPLLKKDIEVKIITREDLDNEKQVETVNYLLELEKKYRNIKVKFIDYLHAKMIVIDDVIGIEGSLNLTLTGLFGNIECVRKYTDKNIINKIIREFENIFK